MALYRSPQNVFNPANQVVQAGANTGAYIEQSLLPGVFQCLAKRFGDVTHMDIVARDTTIAPDLDRNAFYGMVQEHPNSALSSLEALALAIRVSNPQRYGLDAVKALIDLQSTFLWQAW